MSNLTRADLLAKGCGRYLDARQLEDGSWAVLAQLLFTQAICLGVTEDVAYEHRFCYDDAITCRNQFNGLKSKDDMPQGWIASRPQE